MKDSLVSVIMPCFNAEKYIAEAIDSVLKQDYRDLELVIVNDGSSDRSGEIIKAFGDPRIRYYEQENQGVSAARNLGLVKSSGSFICFLDADDVMIPSSVSARVQVLLEDAHVEFVTGGQEHWNEPLTERLQVQLPSFDGPPKMALARLNDRCFINCGALMIRRMKDKKYQFPVGWTHCEDIAFFFSISHSGLLRSVPMAVQKYRRHDTSAMGHLKGLERGYLNYYELVQRDSKVTTADRKYLKMRILRIMALSYLSELSPGAALRVSIKMLSR